MSLGRTPFLYDICQSNVPGHSTLLKFGKNPDIKTSFETLWEVGGLYQYIESTPKTLYMSSSNDNDNQEIKCFGLGPAWAEQNSIVALNGQQKVEIGQNVTWWRIWRAFNNDSSELQGDVYIYEDDTLTSGVPNTVSKIKTKITNPYGQTHQSFWTVPAGTEAFWVQTFCETSASKEIEVIPFMRLFGKSFRSQFSHTLTAGSPNIIPYPFSKPIPEKTDIEMRSKCKTAEGVVVSGAFWLYYRNT